MSYNENLLTHGCSVLPEGLIGMLDYIFTDAVPYAAFGRDAHAAAIQITKYLFEKTFNNRMCCLRTGRRKYRTRDAVDILLDYESPKFVKEVIVPAITKMLPEKCNVVFSAKLKRLRIEHVG